MDGADGIADGSLYMSAFLLCSLDGGLQVAGVVHGVENPENVDTVGDGLLYEIFHHVICIMAVSQNILAAEQHLQLGVLHFRTDLAQSFPGIFVQKAEAGVEGGAAPCFQRMIPDFIHFCQNRQHFVRSHTGSDQRLVRVPEHRFGNFYFCHSIIRILSHKNQGGT